MKKIYIEELELRENPVCPICESKSRINKGSRGPSTHNITTPFNCSPEILKRLEDISVFECEECHALYCDPMPVYDQKASSQIYDEEYCDKHRDNADEASKQQRIRANANLLEKFAGNLKLSGDVKHLDVGAGAGEILLSGMSLGWASEGLDLSHKVCEYGKRVNNIDVHCCDIFDDRFQANSYDLITLYDIIEHVDDPVGLLKRTQELLAPGGGVYISTPNEKGLVIRTGNMLKGGGQTMHLSPTADPYHLFGYSPESIRYMLADAGFELVGLEHKSVKLHVDKTSLLTHFLTRGMNFIDYFGARLFNSGSEMFILAQKSS